MQGLRNRHHRDDDEGQAKKAALAAMDAWEAATELLAAVEAAQS